MSKEKDEFLKRLKLDSAKKTQDPNYADFVFACLNSEGPHNKTQKQLEEEASSRNLANRLSEYTKS